MFYQIQIRKGHGVLSEVITEVDTFPDVVVAAYNWAILLAPKLTGSFYFYEAGIPTKGSDLYIRIREIKIRKPHITGAIHTHLSTIRFAGGKTCAKLDSTTQELVNRLQEQFINTIDSISTEIAKKHYDPLIDHTRIGEVFREGITTLLNNHQLFTMGQLVSYCRQYDLKTITGVGREIAAEIADGLGEYTPLVNDTNESDLS